MHIPSVYLLFTAELLLILLGITVILSIYVIKLRKKTRQSVEIVDTDNNIDLGTSYIEFLEKELLRNEARSNMQQSLEADDEQEDPNSEETFDDSGTEKASHLLEVRKLFLNLERKAAEHTENEHEFWDNILKGMDELFDEFKTIERETLVVHDKSALQEQKKEAKEKVFYIETQGKKVDGEVNKLKDIIFDQENALNSLKKALQDAPEALTEDEEVAKELHSQLEALDRQLNDSKMCMEVLELENTRLQEEVDEMETRYAELFADKQSKGSEDSMVDLAHMKEVLEKQERQIAELHSTIEGLEIEAGQADKLKNTINDFTRTSQEMMGCITILEEENEHLKEELEKLEKQPGTEGASDQSDSTDNAILAGKIKSLEEELIKKDVAYAKLQDELASMEKEYQAMYEALHGDN